MDQYAFANLVLFVIVILNVVIIGLVMRVGTQHDEHQDVKEISSSKSISKLYELYGAPPVAEQPLTDIPNPVNPQITDLSIEKPAEELSKAVADLQDQSTEAKHD
ncbi:MAG: hypothetical protein MUF87_12605 [Anaerolineae bacterium]|nr:hypothetical protein [Anaerolineae bacterium]